MRRYTYKPRPEGGWEVYDFVRPGPLHGLSLTQHEAVVLAEELNWRWERLAQHRPRLAEHEPMELVAA